MNMHTILRYLNLADDGQVSNGTLYSTIVALGMIVLWLSLSGCAMGQSGAGIYNIADGDKIIKAHIDTDDRPEYCTHGPSGGCGQQRADGYHIWYSLVSPHHVRVHEIGHSRNMHHTAWAKCNWGRSVCSIVTSSAPGYPLGAVIRVSQSGEDVLDSKYFEEVK